ncbi:MAG: hypothetical protein AB7V42_06560 [Thermoleophilia bacterium]
MGARRRTGHLLGVAAAATAAAWIAGGQAGAVPPGGPVDMPNGAKVSISTAKVVAGGRIRVVGTNWKAKGSRVYGRPVVTIKLDDRDVLATFPIKKKRFAGWVRIPKQVRLGHHWFRFLAAEPATSVKSKKFRVVAPPKRR